MKKNQHSIAATLVVAVALGSAASRAAERMVGVAPSGDFVTLLKQFHVPAGATMVGAEFTTNDPNTTFPEVSLIRDLSLATGAGAVMASATNAQETSLGLVRVFWPTPVVAVQGADYFVSVRFPLGQRKEGIGIGPAIGANDLPEPNGSYVTSGQAHALQPIRVDLDIRLLMGGIWKSSGIGEPAEDTPAQSEAHPFSLGVRTPFPLHDPGGVTFGIERTTMVTLNVYNVAGRRIRSLIHGTMPAGVHHVGWDGRDDRGSTVAMGVYLVRLEAEGQSLARRLVMAR